MRFWWVLWILWNWCFIKQSNSRTCFRVFDPCCLLLVVCCSSHWVILNLIQDLLHKLFMNKTTLSGRFRIRVRNDFMSKRWLRGKSPITTLGDDSLFLVTTNDQRPGWKTLKVRAAPAPVQGFFPLFHNYVRRRSRSASRTGFFRDDLV